MLLFRSGGLRPLEDGSDLNSEVAIPGKCLLQLIIGEGLDAVQHATVHHQAVREQERG